MQKCQIRQNLNEVGQDKKVAIWEKYQAGTNELESIIKSVKYGRLEGIQILNGEAILPPKKIIKKIKVRLSDLPDLLKNIGTGMIQKIEVTEGDIGIIHLEQHST